MALPRMKPQFLGHPAHGCHHTENFKFHLDVETRDILENILVIWGLRFDLEFTVRFDLPYLCFIWWTFSSWDYGPIATSDEIVSELWIGKDTENVMFLTFMGPCIVIIYQYISNKMQRYTVYFIWKLLYMFRLVSPPIIRSTYNFIYSIWYLSCRYCYLPLSCVCCGWRTPPTGHTR